MRAITNSPKQDPIPVPSSAGSTLAFFAAHAAGALLAFAGSVLPQPVLLAASSKLVFIKQMRFQPADIAAAPGDTVVWKNEDIFSHTVTANDGSFDSGPIAPGSSWEMKVGDKTATIGYHCRPHPNMTAQLVVRAAQHAGSENQRVPGGTLNWAPPKNPEQLHPILVNFTAALLPLAFLSDVLGRVLHRATISIAAFWITIYAAVISPFTAAAGWWWRTKTSAESNPQVLTVHQWLGTGLVLLFIALAIWRWRIYKRSLPPNTAYLACEFLVLTGLIYQGSLGGEMVFGH